MIKYLLSIIFLFFFTDKAQAEAQLSFSDIPIMQGATGFNSAQLAVLRKKSDKYTYLIDHIGRFSKSPDRIETKSRSYSEYVIDQLFFDNLKPGSEYLLRILSPNKSILDERFFKTLNPKNRNLKIAFGSCMSDFFLFPQEKMWSTVMFRTPDILFFLGDNVYASTGKAVDPKKLWRRYAETRKKLDIFRAMRLTPVFATWDDHDFGWDNGDKSYPYIKEAQQTFNDFFPQQPIPGVLTRGPGVSSVLEMYNHKFVFTDGRSFRDTEASGSMWGSEQEKWVESQISGASKMVWLISATQVFGKFGIGESLESNFPSHFSRLAGFLQTIPNPFVILSGDIHATEVLRLSKQMAGQETYEITSSSFHSIHDLNGGLQKNPRRIAEYDGDNFILAELNPLAKEPKINIQSFNVENNLNFQLDLSVVGKK